MTIAPSDKRAPLLELLEHYHPIDEVDRAHRDRIVEFVRSNRNCFERTNIVGHVTGSAWVVDKTGECVLLTHHKKLGKWLQLGGHADGDSDVRRVALREAEEESGIIGLRSVSDDIFDLDVHVIPAHGTDPEHYHYDLRFVFQTSGSEEFLAGPESNQLAWVKISDLKSFSSEESMLRMARKSFIRPAV
jgi:8-oxo-dGTP pyrophosphatase MutT (NUDIX family)